MSFARTRLYVARLPRWVAAALLAVSVAVGEDVRASDHADPIDLLQRDRLEPGITDLFVFPVLDDETPAFPFERHDGTSLAAPELQPRPLLSADQKKRIKGLVVILCVRRQLTDRTTLKLEPYVYRIHMDLNSVVSYVSPLAIVPATNPTTGYAAPADPEHRHDGHEHGAGYQPAAPVAGGQVKRPTFDEARARYGGLIDRPQGISDTAVVTLRFKNDGTFKNQPELTGLKDPQSVRAHAGIHDDPFIFPAFFGTNIVAAVLMIPMTCFPEGQESWIVWATSHEGDRQIDHVGRSLRTQNPRFELLNELPPSQHVQAIRDEHENPSLMRDLFLRANIQSLFAYRAWDQVPDVMIYTTRYPVGFPNGRLLTDDVAALLAQHGDTLLLELSHHIGGWPRRTTNDKEFLPAFPYLADPWGERPQPPPPLKLSPRNRAKLIGIAIGLLALLLLENWLVARWYCKRKLRPQRI